MLRLANSHKFFFLSIVSFIGVISINTVNAESITYSPKESDAVLVNPDIGVVDHQTINIKTNSDWNIPSYPQTSVVYYRWYWEELEPEQGQYNFQMIDNVIKEAAALNKKVVIRFMTMAGLDETYYPGAVNSGKKVLGIPCWLKQEIDPKTSGTCADDNSFVIDYHDQVFQERLHDFLSAMGKRYNSNQNLLRLDLGLIGTWGEWHLYSHAPEDSSTLGANGYTAADLQIYIDMMKQAFPDKTLTIDLGTTDDDFTGTATSQGLGWRADCIGDWTPGWNHMENAYPQTLAHIENTTDPQIRSRWKKVPVDFEVCYSMEDWAYQPDVYTKEKVKKTFDTALSQHVSLFNLKSGEIPAMYQAELIEFRKKIGYRFVLNNVSVSGVFKANRFFTIESDWQNKGVAPSYVNYPVAWRLVNSEGKIVTYFYSKNDISTWLPADTLDGNTEHYLLKNRFKFPANLSAGNYELQVGLVREGTQEAKVKLAIHNAELDNWYRLTTLEIK
ncbi:MAG: DUF4832 domain-containing protein [Vibrio sp.]